MNDIGGVFYDDMEIIGLRLILQNIVQMHIILFVYFTLSYPGEINKMIPSRILHNDLFRFTVQNLIFLLLAAVISFEAEAATINATRINNTLSSPVYLTSAPGESDRLFIVEQSGSIQILRKQANGSWAKNSQAFLRLSDSGINVSTGNEQGLLGLAFHPDYTTNGRFYVNYVANGQSHTSEFTTSSNTDIADSSSFKSVLSINRNRSNHNAGWIDFGQDNYLYIASGDSGGGNDPDNVAQNLQ